MLRSTALQKQQAWRALRSLPRMLTTTPHSTATAAHDDSALVFPPESVEGAKLGSMGASEAPQGAAQPWHSMRLSDSKNIPSLLKNRIDVGGSPRLSKKKAASSGSKKKTPAPWNASFLEFVDSIDEPGSEGSR
jgi:hypothetical protein